MTDAAKTALITGGAGGLGRAMAEALTKNGLNAVIFDIDEEAGRRRAAEINERCGAAESCAMSTASFLETSMIVESRYGPDGTRDLDLFISKARITLASVDADQAYVARDAFRRYGKGRHPAGLNFGDCFAYALAKMLGEPLLFKGNDFAATDIAACSLQ